MYFDLIIICAAGMFIALVADLSGLTDHKVLLTAGLDELLQFHMERLGGHTGPTRVIPPNAALTANEAMQSMKANRMERLGLARFISREHDIWRHTLKGAWLQYYRGFRAQLAQGKMQRHRITMKRPGDE